MAKFGFDVAEVAPDTGSGGGNYDPIPEGEYTLMCLDAEEKETQSGGQMIKAKFEVVGGEHSGRWLWQNFNIINKNPKAQQIGRSQLVAWAAACGRPDADDTDKLLNKNFRAEVSIEKGTGGYADSNRIKVFLFDAEKSAAKPAVKPIAKPPTSAPAKGANPWD
jgi:hypothetical protein